MGSLACSGERSRLPLRRQRRGHLPRHLRRSAQSRRCLRRHLSRYPAFAAHSIAPWWKREESRRWGPVPRLLVLADSGGSNSCRCWAWKTEVQAQLSNAGIVSNAVAIEKMTIPKMTSSKHVRIVVSARHLENKPVEGHPQRAHPVSNLYAFAGHSTSSFGSAAD